MGGCLCSGGAGGSNNKKKNQSNPPAAAAAAAANVISVNGDLHRYAVPVTVSQVLLMEMENPTTTTTTTTPSSSSSSSSSTWTPKFFMCNSDRLYYDDYIQALDAEDQLEANQIYFVLPSSRLQYQLTSSDMAALAVKASLALLHNTNTNTNTNTTSSSSSSSSSSSNFKASFLRPHLCCCRLRHNKTSQISPVLFVQVNNNNEGACFSESDHYKPPKGSQSQSQQQGGDGDGDGVWRSGSVKRRLQRYSSRRVQMAVRSFRIRLTTIYEGSVLQFS
ncbi:hypothetical protein LOK49_LG08G00022 [Camellia lanceoleosa]|uniref:Uncharacterized protein n=1 Tax=Camellia lanceoleosa TaxID=1840588 RepID=A0ACC0GS57_9ERIC|nr:hypothetical protein LOK49_LG08G00022 [Camellia lanceoleosa]